MIKNLKVLGLFALAIGLFASCSKDDSVDEGFSVDPIEYPSIQPIESEQNDQSVTIESEDQDDTKPEIEIRIR